MPDEKIILPNDPAAAARETVTGWVSRDGSFYGDGPAGERAARYAGSTHSQCDQCGAICSKGWTACNACREAKAIAAYAKREQREWDGSQMLYSDANDNYYSDIESAEYDLDEGQTLADLRLLLCEPNLPRQLDSSHFDDDLPDDGDHEIPDELAQAVDAFNAVMAASKPLSWSPGKYALKLGTPA